MLDTLAKARNVSTLKIHRWKPPVRIHRKFPRLQKLAVNLNSPRQQPANHRSPRRSRKGFHLNRPEHRPQQNGKQQILRQTFPRRSHGAFALMDLERATNLRAIADGHPLRSAAFELSAIVGKVLNIKETFQSLEFVLQSELELEHSQLLSRLSLVLKRLVEKKWLQRKRQVSAQRRVKPFCRQTSHNRQLRQR